MKSLLGRALLRYRGSEELALDDLAWGFRAYIRDPRERFKPLGRLARTRDEYGRPPAEFRALWRRDQAPMPDRPNPPVRLAPSGPSGTGDIRTGDVSGGGGAAPPTLLELARINVMRAEQALRIGIGSTRAVDKARRLLAELEAKEPKS